MKKVIVASQNPAKIHAVKLGFERMFPNEAFEFIGVIVSSGVSDQPMTDEESLQGATSRAQNAHNTVSEADYYVGLEGGVHPIDTTLQAFAWIVVLQGNKMGKSRTGTFFLPHEVVKLIHEGKELGVADDIVFQRYNSKQKNGAVGILTDDVIDRAELYAHAVVLALIPFKKSELY